MGQSLVKNYIHIIFSTKNRQGFIESPIDQELYAYIAGVCKNLECHPLAVGGHVDHVHILCMLSKKRTLVELLLKVKSNSSKWMKTKGKTLQSFAWQDGYGAFSVNPREVDKVLTYIQNQHLHHAKKTFQEEYLAFLKQYKVEYDERYVWG